MVASVNFGAVVSGNFGKTKSTGKGDVDIVLSNFRLRAFGLNSENSNRGRKYGLDLTSFVISVGSEKVKVLLRGVTVQFSLSYYPWDKVIFLFIAW